MQLLRGPEELADFAAESHAGRVFPSCGKLGQDYGHFLSTLEAYAIRRAAVPLVKPTDLPPPGGGLVDVLFNIPRPLPGGLTGVLPRAEVMTLQAVQRLVWG